MKFKLIAACTFINCLTISNAQTYKVIESTNNIFKVEFNFENQYQLRDTLIDGKQFQYILSRDLSFRNPGEPWLPNFFVNIGVPQNANPKVSITKIERESYKNKFIIPFPKEDPDLEKFEPSRIDRDVYSSNKFFPAEPAELDKTSVMRYVSVAALSISPFQFNPVTRELVFNKRLTIQIDYNAGQPELTPFERIKDKISEDFVEYSLINKNEAKYFIGKSSYRSESPGLPKFWYNPSKNYYKIFLKDKGVYRLTYDRLVSAGLPVSNLQLDKFEMYNDDVQIPINVVDSDLNNVFSIGDYIEFVGYPPKSSPNTYLNIYNLSNVYWLSYESDSTGMRYKKKEGNLSNFNNTYQTNLTTLHYEKDSLYERLGYALDDKRDYWFWDKAVAISGQPTYQFSSRFPPLSNFNTDTNKITVRVNMHGMTDNRLCNPEHKAYISLTDQPLGNLIWDGQSIGTFESTFSTAPGGVQIYPAGNMLQVKVTGELCNTKTDEIRINWYELEYWRFNRADVNYLNFFSPPGASGLTRFWTWRWERDTVRILIPQKAEMIVNPLRLSDNDKSVIVVDDVNGKTEYFCIGSDYFLLPDSIVKDNRSDLRNIANEADYIIISHEKFKSVAERLASFRASNFPDESIPSPRIKIVYVNEIYDEFSAGLLDPFALKSFVKYAFENWKPPAPSYVVLLGDMSYDYRQLSTTSRLNYVPSIPYHSVEFGQAASDNMIAAVAGDDPLPDLAIGRLSCETVDEGNVLVDKLMNYPDDKSKQWKQNIILLASGLNEADETLNRFNDESTNLDDWYLKPNGLTTTKVFRYPNRPEYQPFKGEGPEIRNAFNKGGVLANYYGHGGGYQRDLVFLNDDIYLLENGGMLPMIISVTCFTAHFDNQNVFGEQFNKVPGKGSIGFFGSSGLTIWPIGKYMNNLIFDLIFNKRNYIIGTSVLLAKSVFPTSRYYASQVALQTLLSDPVLKLAIPNLPDFEVKAADIKTIPENPVVDDSVQVKIKFRNLGVISESDSINVQLFASSSDTSYSVVIMKREVVGEEDSLSFIWVPKEGGLYELQVKLNELDPISEIDHSDNSAVASVVVYNISNPGIISPIDGYAADKNSVEFLFADIGHYISSYLTYFIEIDTSLSFNQPIKSSPIVPADALVKWQSPVLQKGIYFWRARIFNGQEYGNWSPVRTFSLLDQAKDGFYAAGKQLQLFETYNINFNGSTLSLNKSQLPPRPANNRFIEDILVNSPVLDTVGLTTITTDGTYIYFANIWYYALGRNQYGRSKIYKVGTGLNGTSKGQFYGEIPNFYAAVNNQIFYHSDGFIYVSTGDPYHLLKVDKTTGSTSEVTIPAGMLRWEDAAVKFGSFYITSDGRYAYNLTVKDTLGNKRYFLRTFDPSNNWSLVKEDMLLSGTSYEVFTGFFVADGYLYPYEYYYNGFMRKIRLSDGYFEEEWITYEPFQSYYAWCFDWTNNFVYSSVFRSYGYKPKFSKFHGRYLEANGSIVTREIGPAAQWNNLSYDLEKTGAGAKYSVKLQGFDSNSRSWEDVVLNLPSSFDLEQLSAARYPKFRLSFQLVDSSYNENSQINLKSVSLSFTRPAELLIRRDLFTFSPDSSLQGIPYDMSMKIFNVGFSDADSVKLKFYLNEEDSAFYSSIVNLPQGGQAEVNQTISTVPLIFNNSVKVTASTAVNELITFNNLSEKKFYVVRDSSKPAFSITFDGKEILNEDIVSSKPEVLITLQDNSPLPLDTSFFTIIYNNTPMTFSQPNLTYAFSPYPNSEAKIKWTPELKNGKHTLEVLAKDASGNFFDSTARKIVFNVEVNPGIRNVVNYPNPFENDTYFTFEITGSEIPESFRIKIFTVAGRLIKELIIPAPELKFGFNRIRWDGLDEDGDAVANGLYFYKIVYAINGTTRTEIQKIVRMQ